MRGIGTVLQIGKETTYGTAVPATDVINFLSESLKNEVGRLEEDTLLAGKTTPAMDIVSYKVSGDFSVILKPENVGLLLGLALGKEATPVKKIGTTGVYNHAFTLQDAGELTPSFTAEVDRHVAIKTYAGLKIESLSLEGKAGDYLRSTVSVKGMSEETDTLTGSLTTPTKKSFQFTNGSLSIDSDPFTDVSGATFTLTNGLDDGSQTLGSGLYFSEPEFDLRTAEITIDAFYDSDSDTIRDEKYVAGAKAAVILTYVSPEEIETGEAYKIVITMPNVEITEAHPNIAGRDRIMLQLKGKALEVGATEPLTIEYYSEKVTAYI